MANPQLVAALVDELRRRGIEVPAAALHGRDLLDTVAHERLVALPAPTSLLDLTAADLRSHVERLAFLARLQADLGESGAEVAKSLAGEVAAVLRDSLDPILAQLRPSFDAAGVAVHAAVRLGIQPGHRADAVIGLGDDAVVAWRGLSAHVSVLDDIAGLRVRLTDALGTDPLPDPFNYDQRAYAACFTTSGGLWSARHEDSRDRWLRLSAAEPVRLLTVAETRAAATPYQLLPSGPQVIEDEDEGGLRVRARAARVAV